MRLIFNIDITPDEWTEDEQAEQQQLADQQANQEPQEDPLMVEARGIELSGQADVLNAQTKQSEAQFNAQVKGAEVTLEQDKVALDREKLQFAVQKFLKGQDDKFNVDAAKIQQGERKLDQEQEKIQLSAQDQRFEQLMESNKAMAAEIKTNAESFKIMADAMQTFVGPGIVEAGIKQAQVIQESQEEAGAPDIEV